MKEIELTPEQIDELATLQQSEYVKLARRERRLKYRKRQQLYILRNLEKRGKQLADSGITAEILEKQILEVESIMDELNDAETV